MSALATRFRIVGIFWLVTSFAPVQAAAISGRAGAASLIRSLLEETNRARLEHAQTRLELADDLSAAAQAHAEDMLARGYFAHLSPDGDGPPDRMRAKAPRTIVLGLRENITKTEGDSDEGTAARAREIIDGWLRSKGHRQNLLSGEVAQVGFGVARSAGEGARVEYTVQLLARVAGRWEDTPKAEIRTPARWAASLDLPIDFFLRDLSRLGRPYSGPEGSTIVWTGGLPLEVIRDGARRFVAFPALDPGRYMLMARLPAEKGYQELREIKVLR